MTNLLASGDVSKEELVAYIQDRAAADWLEVCALNSSSREIARAIKVHQLVQLYREFADTQCTQDKPKDSMDTATDSKANSRALSRSASTAVVSRSRGIAV